MVLLVFTLVLRITLFRATLKMIHDRTVPGLRPLLIGKTFRSNPVVFIRPYGQGLPSQSYQFSRDIKSPQGRLRFYTGEVCLVRADDVPGVSNYPT